MTPTPLPPRFAAKITVSPSGCWLFTGCLNSRGYGCITHHGRVMLAHRLAYELLVGPIPQGRVIDHLCMVKACCNPDHLEAVTAGENNRRAVAANGAWRTKATACRRGHAYTEANTYTDHRGHRQCRACKRVTDQRAHARRKASA